MNAINEPARSLPVAASFDVIVAGGGIAGVAAAMAARRAGAQVCVVEKATALGGLATLGNVTVWLPICDGLGRQVIGGLGEELLRLSVSGRKKEYTRAGFTLVPACWEEGGDPEERRRKRFRVGFNPAAYILTLEDWLRKAGVTLLYDTRVCSLNKRGDRISHVIVENKGGRQALAGKVFVDASGDADLCHLAGEETESLDTNVACGWFYYFKDGELNLRQSTRYFNADLSRPDSAYPSFRGDDGWQVSQMVLESNALIREMLTDLQEKSGETEIQPFALPGLPCFRATRRLAGSFTLEFEHCHEWFEDTCGLTGDWRKAGPVLAIPWRTLCAVKTGNLVAAGRCMSSAGRAWDITRAIPGCAVTGEAAGTAAAIALQGADGDLRDLDVAELQERLVRNGGLLDPELVKPGGEYMEN